MTPLHTDWKGALIRLSLSLLVGAVIGWERQLDHKSAGLRTHMLVSLGSAIFVLTSIQIGAASDSGASDIGNSLNSANSMNSASANIVSRAIQGIAAGIGFLGAGEIINKTQQSGAIKVQGLTSAAAIWVSAALGVAVGCGQWEIALFGAIATFLTLRLLKKVERRN